MNSNHSLYIRRCFDLAHLGTGRNKTNPLVGAVIAADNLVIGEGYHRGFGLPHAEVDAFENMSHRGHSSSEISEMFVSLEPCNHFGKTPPCSHLIARNGVSKIIVSIQDPNLEVAGGGLKFLQEKGCQVEKQILPKKGSSLIRPFTINHKKKRPYVILKWAQSPEGYIGKHSHQAKISNPTSDRMVHKWRSETDAIMIGTNTAVIDNPHLTTRLYPGSNPVRIVLDKHLRLPSHLNIFDGSVRTLVCTAISSPEDDLEKIVLPFDNLLIPELLSRFLHLGFSSLMIEGGARLLSTFIDQDLWDECRLIVGTNHLAEGIKAPIIKGKITREMDLLGDRLYQIHNTNI